MALTIATRFAFSADKPTDVLLQFEAASLPEQAIRNTSTTLPDAEHCARIPAEDDIGERIWLRVAGQCEVQYEASVEVRRQLADLSELDTLPPHHLPGEAVRYLLDSRYCPADRFQPFVEAEFGSTSGGARVAALRDWIEDRFTYTPGASGPDTGAVESFVSRQGVCRDYAHMLVTLARASAIPARYVSCFAPGVTPQDFHAVAEVFLADPEIEDGGTWQIVDATGMALAAETVKIGVGRDAADVSFLTSFGACNFISSEIDIRKE
ncbi:transglutaminase family protein [Qipengyuania sp. XHP0207]|uniref:transglutaminase-like domain-containing protein n=1 Tax=Qipengyuania sp. XHP0207 TaxID=3038078 RepID=UPI00241FD4F0|nr:transglutaminase family protein [Qipengyuania sp. XHP0207]MDG5749192.1 transglutaminase family protein [Qipengyuania sp. XHP0207]